MRRKIERRAQLFAQKIYAICEVVRRRSGGHGPANQLLDAATSTSANYRAAGRARSHREFVAKLGTTNEEADEVVHWLEFIAGTALGKDIDLKDVYAEACELRAIFAASYATARRNTKKKRNPPKDESRELE